MARGQRRISSVREAAYVVKQLGQGLGSEKPAAVRWRQSNRSSSFSARRFTPLLGPHDLPFVAPPFACRVFMGCSRARALFTVSLVCTVLYEIRDNTVGVFTKADLPVPVVMHKQ